MHMSCFTKAKCIYIINLIGLDLNWDLRPCQPIPELFGDGVRKCWKKESFFPPKQQLKKDSAYDPPLVHAVWYFQKLDSEFKQPTRPDWLFKVVGGDVAIRISLLNGHLPGLSYWPRFRWSWGAPGHFPVFAYNERLDCKAFFTENCLKRAINVAFGQN